MDQKSNYKELSELFTKLRTNPSEVCGRFKVRKIEIKK